MLQLQHVTKYYGKNLANDDISFQVEEGQIAILLGPNGAGKSTTMNIMTGCLSATEGHVRIDGKIHHHQVHCGSAPVPGGDHHRWVWE